MGRRTSTGGGVSKDSFLGRGDGGTIYKKNRIPMKTLKGNSIKGKSEGKEPVTLKKKRK